MDRDLLTAIGEHLYGKNWKSPMAELLNLSVRQVSRWINEGHKPPLQTRHGLSVYEVLVENLTRHGAETNDLIVQLQRSVMARARENNLHHHQHASKS
jgi:hypothetical protein